MTGRDASISIDSSALLTVAFVISPGDEDAMNDQMAGMIRPVWPCCTRFAKHCLACQDYIAQGPRCAGAAARQSAGEP